jgi:hypothetical protein
MDKTEKKTKLVKETVVKGTKKETVQFPCKPVYTQ